jgi:RNA polymerase sigma-70 factor (ECF subfamily)
MGDAELIEAVRNGDSRAFAPLVRNYEARIRRLCYSYLLEMSEADDAAQDVFIKAYEGLAQFRENVSFVAWLSRIATNHCLDLLRKRSRRKTDSLDALIDAKGDPTVAPEPDLARDQEAASNQQIAKKVLEQLPPNYREVLVLRELDGLSYEEIAQVLNCSLDAVKARLKRARAELQEKARHYFPNESLTQQENI